MKILLVGFPRTGTVTINAVLEEFGFGPCYHGWTFWKKRARDMPFWKNVYKLQTLKRTHEIDWDEVFMHYESCSDIPSIYFYKDIYRQYPGMKVILSTRNEEKWVKSFTQTVGRILGHPFTNWVIHNILYTVAGTAFQFLIFMNKLAFFPMILPGHDWKVFYEKAEENKRFMIENFLRHNQEIIEYFGNNDKKNDKFIILDWERKNKNAMFLELMEFLDVQLSENAIEKRLKENNGSLFPHKNNTNTMRIDVSLIIIRYAILAIVIAVAVFAFLYLLLFAFKVV